MVKRFFIKLVVFLLPFLLLLAVYILTDPFKVIYNYNAYYQDKQPQYVSVNRDYASLETLKHNYPIYEYDSYILGNSRSMYFNAALWAQHIGSSKTFHFDAYSESLYGVESKLQYLMRHNMPVKNALFVIDHNVLTMISNHNNVLTVKHPELSGESTVSYHSRYLRAFFDVSFLTAFLDFKISNRVKSYMKASSLIDDNIVSYKLPSNELALIQLEELIQRNADSVYNARAHLFYKRDTANSQLQPIIKTAQLQLLQNIRDILQKKGTNYKFIISPLYDQKKLHSQDIKILEQLFGADKVYDFSGINTITNDMRNYYETSHYRTIVADQLVNTIYK